MPKYSIVVPTYNVENYIEKCLRSILAQDFEDYEIIVVNDGSTDESAIVVEKMVSEYPNRIRLISQENKGLGGARNTGIQEASGEYILFIDSDDTVSEKLLSEVDKKICETDSDIIIFDIAYIDEHGTQLSYLIGSSQPTETISLEEYPEILFTSASACNKVYRRSLFTDNNISFPEHLFYEDLCTTTKFYHLTKKITYLPQCLYFYLQRSGSIMYSKNIERNREIITSTNILFSYYKKQGLFEKYKKEFEYIAVFHIYVLAATRVIKGDCKSPLIKEFRDYIHNNFPDFKNNKYCVAMPKKEKIIINLLEKKHVRLLKWMFKLKGLIK